MESSRCQIVQNFLRLSNWIGLISVIKRVLEQLFSWASMEKCSSEQQKPKGAAVLDVWQLWLRLAEAGRRAAQPQTPIETVTEWAKAEHTVTLASLSLDQDTQLTEDEGRRIKCRRMRRDIAQVCAHLPLNRIQTLKLPSPKQLLTYSLSSSKHKLTQNTQQLCPSKHRFRITL